MTYATLTQVIPPRPEVTAYDQVTAFLTNVGSSALSTDVTHVHVRMTWITIDLIHDRGDLCHV